MIHVGASGYHFKDWKGEFYPRGLADSRMLGYYARFFDVVEINSTYYRIPAPRQMESLVAKTPPHFRFTVKTHQSLTHERKGDAAADRAFLDALRPLAESGRLIGLLAQFPWSFRRGPENLDYLLRVRDAMSPHPMHVEFRNDSWARPETYSSLREQGIGFCVVDAPRLDGLMPFVTETTTDTAYFRFHGRNSVDWWKPRPGSDRYLYDYTEEELTELAGAVRGLSGRARTTLVFMNNCHFGHAPRNAKRLKELLDLPAAYEPEGELKLES